MTDVILLDGGMGQELVRRAGEPPTPLWSTQVMIDRPGLVAEVHADFRAAGATVHVANTYAIHRDRLRDPGLEDQFEELMGKALTEVAGPGRIAGSIGPLIASYRPDIHPSADVAVPLYAEVAGLLADGCDLILCETVASLDHARSVLRGARTADLPVWMALTLDDADGGRLRSGEALEDALPIVQEGADAVLINCTAPEAIPKALGILATGALPFGAYANGFVQITKAFLQDKPTVDSLTARGDLGPDAYARHALGWVEQGATIIGGCCEVGPAHIEAVAEALRGAGHRIV